MPNSVKDDLRDAAIGLAFREFRATGSISMRRVGGALNVTAAALYHHFANKEALVDAVTDRAFLLFEKRLKAIDETGPRKVIHGILGQYRAFAVKEPALFGLMFVASRPSARRFPRDFAKRRSAVFNILWNAVEKSLPDSAAGTSDEALHLAHDLWALAHGQILLWRAGRFESKRTFDRVFDRSINRFISTL